MENIHYSTLLIPIITGLAYKYYSYNKNSKNNQIPVVSHLQLAKVAYQDGKQGVLDLLKTYKEQGEPAVYVWILGWKLLILDHEFFRELAVNNRMKIDRSCEILFVNKESALINFFGQDSLGLSNREDSKKYFKIILPYLKGEQMKKNVDICTSEMIEKWKGEINVVDLSNSFSFNVICQVLLDCNGSDIYDEFNNLLKSVFKWYNLPFKNKELNEKVFAFRNKIKEASNSSFFDSMSKAGFNQDEIVNTISSLMVAGFETTSYSLSRCIYELGKNVAKQNELRNNPESIRDFIKELLFIYTPADFISVGFHTMEEVNINDIFIPKNIHCVGVANLMNNKDIPESFTTFSIGSRACPGMTMAFHELETLTRALLKKYRWEIKKEFSDKKDYPVIRRMEEFKCNFIELNQEIKEIQQECLIEQPKS